jgi:hypothetical protein
MIRFPIEAARQAGFINHQGFEKRTLSIFPPVSFANDAEQEFDNK